MNPDGPAASPLGRARELHRSGHHGRAREVLLKAMQSGETPAGAWRLLAAIENALGDWAGAADAFERATRAAPEDLAGHEGLGRALMALGDLEGVGRLVDRLESAFPDAAVAPLLAAHRHKAIGDYGAAEEDYARALERDPDNGEALFGLVDLDAASVDDRVARHAARLAAREDVTAAHRINAAFACARILDASGRYDEAMKYLTRANEAARADLARRRLVYDPAEAEAAVTRSVESYPPASFVHGLEPLGVGVTPIFVVGLPRSGTTLIEQILAAHPRVDTGGELTAGLECERRFRRRREAEGRGGPVEPTDETDAGLLAEARERYLDALFERGLDADLVVDKMPGNFRIAGFLRLLFPDAPIVHSLRDARATCFSLYSANFGSHEPYYHDLAHLAHYYRQYARLMSHWREVVPGPFVEVRYEELVRDPRARIDALLEAIGLEPHPDCHEFHRQRRPVLTASHAQVRRPIYAAATDHWRHYAAWLGPSGELTSL